MELGLFTDSVAALSFEDALDLAAGIGATAIEISTGGTSTSPHMQVYELLEDRRKRDVFMAAFEQRGLRLSALNCSSWPLHPVKGAQEEQLIRATIELASQLGVSKIVTMAGNPGDGPNASIVNWIFYPWPPEMVDALDRQWDMAIPFWRGLAAFAESKGIRRIAFELHPLALVYNVPTLLRLRDAVGPILGANMDPSHMFWQQMDPVRIVRTLGDAVFHVHLKDTALVPSQVALAGVLDQRSFADPKTRAWNFRTVGRGHPAEFWRRLLVALRDVGYDDALSIENEDIEQPAAEGVTEAANFIRPLIA